MNSDAVNDARFSTRPGKLLLAASLVVLACRTGPVIADPPARSAPPATGPAQVSIQDRVREEFRLYGNVDALTREMRSKDQNDPVVLDETATVAAERGQTIEAIDALQKLMVKSPDDFGLTVRLAALQEQVGALVEAERNLRHAVNFAPDANHKAEVNLRLALLAFDAGRVADGNARLDDAVAADGRVSSNAGLIAFLQGQYAASERYLGHIPGVVSTPLLIMRGNAMLNCGRAAAAVPIFEAALAGGRDGDRNYIQERLVASARATGTLPALADRWLADPDMPDAKLIELAAVLRELGRSSDLVTLWRRKMSDPVLVGRRCPAPVHERT